MPPAARITDMHVCPMVNPGPVPHVGGPTTSGEGTVLIGYVATVWRCRRFGPPLKTHAVGATTQSGSTQIHGFDSPRDT